MFHLLDYNLLNGAADVNVDMLAVTDPTFTRRGGSNGTAHYIFTERMNLLGAWHGQSLPTNLRFNVPTWNAYGQHTLRPLTDTTTLVMPSPMWVDDYRDSPLQLPVNEEIALQESNAGAGTLQANTLLWIAPPDWTNRPPASGFRITIPFTASVVGSLGAWSADTAITPAQNLREGIYAINGATAFDAAATPTQIAFRLNFPSAPLYAGQFKLYPGDLIFSPRAAIPIQSGQARWGRWGNFSSFNLPQIQCLAVAAGTRTITLLLDCTYLGSSNNMGLLTQQ